MKECRCVECGSLLGTDLTGSVKIKCHKAKCKTFNIFDSEKQTGADQQTFIKNHEKITDGTPTVN